MFQIWVAALNISYDTAQKIIHEHQPDPAGERAAMVGVKNLPVRRHVHPERGERYLIRTDISGDRCQVVL